MAQSKKAQTKVAQSIEDGAAAAGNGAAEDGAAEDGADEDVAAEDGEVEDSAAEDGQAENGAVGEARRGMPVERSTSEVFRRAEEDNDGSAEVYAHRGRAGAVGLVQEEAWAGKCSA